MVPDTGNRRSTLGRLAHRPGAPLEAPSEGSGRRRLFFTFAYGYSSFDAI